MDVDDAGGLVFVRPLFSALAKFDNPNPNFGLFSGTRASIDTATEQKRVAAVKFARTDSRRGIRIDGDGGSRATQSRPQQFRIDKEVIAALRKANAASQRKILVPPKPRSNGCW